MSDVQIVDVHGDVDPSFAPVHDVFARTVSNQGQGGMAVAVYHRGRKVVDLWAGDYSQSSLQQIYSISKAVTTILIGRLIELDQLDIDTPIRRYWPEFDKPSTAGIRLRDVMSHRSGLSAFREAMSFEDILAGADEAQIARIEPWWKPGTAHGYHAMSFGSIVGGVVRRSTGASVGELVQGLIADPLHLELWIGAPDTAIERVESLQYEPTAITRHEATRERIPDTWFDTLAAMPGGFENRDFLRACLPAASGISDARSLARLFASTIGEVDGVQSITGPTRADLARRQSWGMDKTLGVVSAYSTGFELPFPQLPYTGPSSFGHEGAGGTIAFADPDLDIAVGVTTSVYPHMHGASIPGIALLGAIRVCAEQLVSKAN